MSNDRRVWVGLLGSYNAGKLNGEWMDAEDLDEDGVAELLSRLQMADPIDGGDELDIFDTEGWGSVDPKAFRLADLAELSDLLDEQPEAEALIAAHGTHYYHSVSDLRDGLDSVTIYGPCESTEDYVHDLIESGVIEVPESIVPYLDMDAMARDYTMDATEVITDSGIFLVFG